MQTKLSYQQNELIRLAQVLGTDSDRSLITRLHLLERDVKDLEAQIKDQSVWSKQIKLALFVSFLGLACFVASPLLQTQFRLTPTLPPSPSPEWFDPGPGEN